MFLLSVCLFLHRFRFVSLHWLYIYGFYSIFCLVAILDSVVAPSNKEFYFLYAVGSICEFSSIFYIDTVVAPGNKQFLLD